MGNDGNTIADVALGIERDEVLKESKKDGASTSKADKTTVKKYVPGSYRSDKFMRIIKELTFSHSKDSTGKIQKTYGTWSKPSNMIIFRKGVETVLTEEDLKLPAIQRLIDSKSIYRIG